MSKAGEMFDAYLRHQSLESRMEEDITEACGFPRFGDDLPWEWLTFDYYDNSFEFKNVIPGWKPSEEEWAKCWALGFSRCWICYKDGTEKERNGVHYCSPALLRNFPGEPETKTP